MTRIRNKATGIVYEVSEEQLTKMRQGEIFASTFEVITVPTPPEVIALEKKKRGRKKKNAEESDNNSAN